MFDIVSKQPCKHSYRYPLARHTTWRVGGHAKICFQPCDYASFKAALTSLPKAESLYFLGLGSNTLIRDGGIDGCVFLTRGLNLCIKLSADPVLAAQCGVSCASLARFAARQHVGGFEFLAGIPGTIGGALAMNAGANGSEIWDFVDCVFMINRYGDIIKRGAEEFTVEYRKVESAREEWFYSAHLRGFTRQREESQALIKSYLQRRSDTQPINQANCGCVFKNPHQSSAGQIIEQAGLKGFAIGGAKVSDKHANFILNTGHASSTDIELLLQHITDTVFNKYAIKLQHEVKIIGKKI